MVSSRCPTETMVWRTAAPATLVRSSCCSAVPSKRERLQFTTFRCGAFRRERRWPKDKTVTSLVTYFRELPRNRGGAYFRLHLDEFLIGMSVPDEKGSCERARSSARRSRCARYGVPRLRVSMKLFRAGLHRGFCCRTRAVATLIDRMRTNEQSG